MNGRCFAAIGPLVFSSDNFLQALEKKREMFRLGFVPLALGVDESKLRQTVERLQTEVDDEEFVELIGALLSMAPLKKDRPEFVDMIEAAAKEEKPMDEEITEQIEAIGSPSYWRNLCPALSIGRDVPFLDIEETPLSKEQRNTILSQLVHDGYFKSAPVLSPSLLARMRTGLHILRENGLAPVFAYVFDEFWEIARAPSLQAIVTQALGSGCRQSPRVWAFHLGTENGAAGWPPHVDGGHLAHTTDRLTLWLPITDVTLENGCMNVVPKHLLPPTLPDDFANDARSLSPQVWKTMLQGARPLPAQAGSLLAWDFQVVHWSGFCHGAIEPRMSLAVEIMGPSVEPTEGELPLFDLNAMPPFRERLRAIAKGLLSYQRFEPVTLRYKGLAQRMLDKIDLEIW